MPLAVDEKKLISSIKMKSKYANTTESNKKESIEKDEVDNDDDAGVEDTKTVEVEEDTSTGALEALRLRLQVSRLENLTTQCIYYLNM
jgi:hypothetical protein